MSEYTIDYFISKFESIPEEQWLANGNYIDGNKKCAYGHCGVDFNKPSEEADALHVLIRSRFMLSSVNDGGDYSYQQQTPKARILAALNDLKNKQSCSS